MRWTTPCCFIRKHLACIGLLRCYWCFHYLLEATLNLIYGRKLSKERLPTNNIRSIYSISWKISLFSSDSYCRRYRFMVKYRFSLWHFVSAQYRLCISKPGSQQHLIITWLCRVVVKCACTISPKVCYHCCIFLDEWKTLKAAAAAKGEKKSGWMGKGRRYWPPFPVCFGIPSKIAAE